MQLTLIVLAAGIGSRYGGLKQRKRAKPIADFLQSLGVPEWRAWILALSGKGWWRRAGSPPATEAMSIRWFTDQGLVSLIARYTSLQR